MNNDIFLLLFLMRFFPTNEKSAPPKPARKPMLEKLEENRRRTEECTHQTRQKLWLTLKEKHPGESEEHWVKRLKRYGFSQDGIYFKTGENFETDEM